jgi:exonuclease III
LGQLGTGFLAKKEVVKNIIGFEPINERICKLRLKGKYYNIKIINIHAPTEEKDEDTKERFYAELQQIKEKVPKHDLLIILGDYNAKFGRERAYQNVTRNHTLHDRTNRNGELVYEYAIANDMVVASTIFQHKSIHKGTWISPDTLTLNQIDHVLVSNNKRQMIQDVRTLRGPNCDSDHFLVKVIVKQKIIVIKQEFVKKL